MLAPTWYSVTDSSGKMSCYASAGLVNKMHQRGTDVWALVSDFDTNVDFAALYSSKKARTNMVNTLINDAEKYGFEDMYSGGFYPFETLEEHWAYWSRYIQVNRYEDAPRPVYDSLYRLISEKDYFVLTTNVDHCFQKAGFDKKRLFYTCLLYTSPSPRD